MSENTSKKCYRCEREVDSLYLIPYVFHQFCDINICKKCSTQFHKELYKFTELFLEMVDHECSLFEEA